MPTPTTKPRETAAKKKGAGKTIAAPHPGGEIVPAPDITETVAWLAFDAADEEQIITEIVSGELLEALVYEFEAGKGENRKTVRGISYAGVNWCVREMGLRQMGAIGIKEAHMNETHNVDGDPVYEWFVVAIDKAIGTENAGMADAPLYPKRADGSTYPAPHAKRIALSKAQRNAKAGLIPEGLKAELMSRVRGAEIKRVQTDRQRAEVAAGEQEKGRAQGTTAAKPVRPGQMISAPQIRLLNAKLNEGGGHALAEQLGVDPQLLLRAIAMWITKVNGIDRIPKKDVDRVRDAVLDAEASISAITSAYSSPEPSEDREVARWLLGELTAFRDALKLPPIGGSGEGTGQQKMV